MISHAVSYHRHRFPAEIISHAVWLYHRFCLSFRDTEDLLAQRGITVSYETIRQWCRRFGPAYARILRRRQGRLGDTWYLDELFVNIQGCQRYLWRAVDQDGDVIDILVQPSAIGVPPKRAVRHSRQPLSNTIQKSRSLRRSGGRGLAAQAGDLEAFGRLVQVTQVMAYAVALGVLRDRSMASAARTAGAAAR